MYAAVLACLGVMNLILLAVYLHAWTRMTGVGRLAFGGVVFAWFPLFWGAAIMLHGLNDMKRVEFCNSCHPMEAYVASLTVEDADSLPASHYRNNRIPQKTACYSCHSEYGMFGDVKAKLTGLKHVWVHYFGETPEKIELYKPYANRDCLRCHGTAQNYLDMHEDDLEDIRTGASNCLECHDVGHVLNKGGNP